MGASRNIMNAAVKGPSTQAQGGFSPISMLQQQDGKFPENTTQKPSFAGRGVGMLGAAGGGIPKAIGMITGGRGKATFSGDSFSEMDKKEKKDSKEDEYRTFRVKKDLDYEATRKRLLELAKEESIKINAAKEADKIVYDRSLPNQDMK